MTRRLIDHEPLIKLEEAARYFKRRTTRKPSIATLYRWAALGARGRILETVLIGRDRYTSEPACVRFMHGEPGVIEHPAVDHAIEAPAGSGGSGAAELEARVSRRRSRLRK